VVEHGLERGARARVEAPRDRGEAGAEEPGQVGPHVQRPDVGLGVRGFGTDLHTRGVHTEVGQRGQQRGVERIGRERVLDVILEATHRDLSSARDPRRVEGLGAPRPHQGRERLRLRDREGAPVPRHAERGRLAAGALEPKEGAGLPCRHPEALAGVEAERAGTAKLRKGEQERIAPGEEPALERRRPAEPSVELARAGRLEPGHECQDEGRGFGGVGGRKRGRLRGNVASLGLLLLVLAGEVHAASLKPIPGGELWIHTDYSTIILREKGTRRFLYFVRDSGEQMVEGAMDMAAPQNLLIGYMRLMFASYLFVPEPRRVLIVGLGAGCMVRFLEHHEPEVEIVALDIDPKMVEIAADYFGATPKPTVRLLAADGFEFIRTSKERFDVIYMDAFLKPYDGTDSTGVPLDMKTKDFYERVQDRLTDRGVVVFNVNIHPGLDDDVARIRESFPGIHVFSMPRSANVVVVATRTPVEADATTLREVARSVDERIRAPFEIEGFVRERRNEP
jgi:spermidine synthase